MQKIIKTTRYGIVSSSSDFLAALSLRLVRWLSAPPAQDSRDETAVESTGERIPRRRAGDPIGSVRFDGERLGGWPGEGKIR
ncbi:hypothetical protein H5407_22560 [Mitsuaria sp. WAJ17]|uniref:hypothetical protein n=1 Tax=Mitsuaria sp. WAJ17 TaxID=2761452 RepID=UPI001601E39A|nr:hypothetical protein [Mitsuaria sp. WAJ17]MBB2488028.1 hypothetical protein [Mitsuaria sp. WAJ17]